MAEKHDIYVIDDLHAHQNDGAEIDADETVVFGLDGKQYEIDLGKENATKLREAVASYVAAARVLGKAPKAKPPTRTAHGGVTAANQARSRTDRSQSQAIREWARSRKMKVSERGRIPEEILTAFAKAHPTA